ncbi:MAG: hypothetical protein AAGG81_02440 [Chlamydiota bacterium]
MQIERDTSTHEIDNNSKPPVPKRSQAGKIGSSQKVMLGPSTETTMKVDERGRDAIVEGGCCGDTYEKCRCHGSCAIGWGACCFITCIFIPCGVALIIDGMKDLDKDFDREFDKDSGHDNFEKHSKQMDKERDEWFQEARKEHDEIVDDFCQRNLGHNPFGQSSFGMGQPGAFSGIHGTSL